MTGKIFINYRRGDDPGTTGRLYDRLEAEFSAGQLFMDVEGHIKGGDDFVEVLRAQVAQCDVLLAIIGPRWLEIADEQGRRRLDNPEDWVRVEIAGALKDGKRVIPVLVGGADIPRADDLPDDLKPLARRQVIRITLERFKADAQGLISQIKAALAEIEARRHAETEAERQAAAEAEARRQADEAARTAERERQEAERARQQALAGLSPEAIRQALEVENWAFVKDKDDPAELRDHIARFGGGETERFAAARLASLEWAALGPAPGKDALEDFLDEFAGTPEANAAQAALDRIAAAEAAERAAAERRARETEAWGKVAASTDQAAIAAFLTDWPDGQHAAAAQARLKELRGAGRFSRRAILKGVGYGVGGTVAVVGVGLATVVPGMPIWRLINDQSVRTLTGHDYAIRDVAVTPDASRAVSTSRDDNVIKVWEIATGNTALTFTGHTGFVTRVAVSPDGRHVISGSYDNTLKIWEVATGRELRTLTGHTHHVSAVALTPNGRQAISASSRTLTVFEIETGRSVRTFISHRGWVSAVAVTPDGRHAITGESDKTLTLWEIATGSEVQTFNGHTDRVNAVAVSPDGRYVVSGSSDKTLKVWEIASGREARTLTGHASDVYGVAVTPDGRYIVSGSLDKTLKVWEVTSGRELRTLTGHASHVFAVTVTPDGRHAISASADKTLKLWDLTPYRPR